jgi:hypothetical protein
MLHVQALWRRAPRLLRSVHRLRLAQPLSLAIGTLVRKVQPQPAGMLSSSPGSAFLELPW